jgi:hypothetical protein
MLKDLVDDHVRKICADTILKNDILMKVGKVCNIGERTMAHRYGMSILSGAGQYHHLLDVAAYMRIAEHPKARSGPGRR